MRPRTQVFAHVWRMGEMLAKRHCTSAEGWRAETWIWEALISDWLEL